MASITLTTTPQKITGSDTGIIIGRGTFLYAFGSSEPSLPMDRWYQKENEPFNYIGGFGSVWVWKEAYSLVDSSSLEYTLAV